MVYQAELEIRVACAQEAFRALRTHGWLLRTGRGGARKVYDG